MDIFLNESTVTPDPSDAEGKRIATGPLATEASQACSLAAGVPVGTKTTSAAAWDNGGEVDLGEGHSYKVVRVTAVEDTYIVVDDSASDPATTGEFVPAGSALPFPCAGKRYVHHKAVTIAGTIGASAFAAAE